ncbi:MAG: hypothetical protein PHR69_01495, partial [Sphaerochaeta sp.]|nr:hypothetical protein [Sphaerochaeta sp.]
EVSVLMGISCICQVYMRKELLQRILVRRVHDVCWNIARGVFEKFCQNIVPPTDIFGIIGVYERCF